MEIKSEPLSLICAIAINAQEMKEQGKTNFEL